MNKANKKNLYFKRVLFSLSLFLVLAFSIVSVQAAASDGSYNFTSESGLNLTGEKAGYDSSVTPEPEILIGRIIQAILSFVGVVFLAFMIYGGVIWLTAQGDNQKVSKAKGIIEESIVGIIIVIIAYAVSSYLLAGFIPAVGGGL